MSTDSSPQTFNSPAEKTQATPLAAATMLGTMTNAVAVVAPEGLWAPQGYEYPLRLAVLGGAVVTTGPGSLSVDARLADKSPWLRGGARPAAASLALGLRAAAVTLVIQA